MEYFISRKIISKWNITIAQQSEIGDSLTWSRCCSTHNILESEHFRFQGTRLKTGKINVLFFTIKIFHATFYIIFLMPKRSGQS